MNIIKDILRGVLIGIANIIPGVSGGTMAVSMGVYDKIIGSITGLFKNFKKSILYLLPLAIGMVLGICGLSFIIKFTLENYPFQTSTLFIGLILGGLPALFSRVKGAKINVGHIVVFIIFFALVVGMAITNGTGDSATDITVNVINIIKLFLVGIVASATMIIPGVSGSLVMMILGFYNIIVSNISILIENLVSFNIPGLIHGLGIFVPFGIGILVGIGVVAKAMEWLFAKKPILTYSAIFGLVIASPIAILFKIGVAGLTVGGTLVAILTFAVGFCIAFFLGKE